MEKDKTLTFDGLDDYVKPFFIEKARDKYLKDFALDPEDIKGKNDEFFIETYAINVRVSRPLIQ